MLFFPYEVRNNPDVLELVQVAREPVILVVGDLEVQKIFLKFCGMRTVLIGAGLLTLFGLRAAKKAGAVEKLEYQADGVPDVRFEGSMVNVDLPVRIINPTNEAFQVQSFYGKVFLNSSYVGDYRIEKSFQVPAAVSIRQTVRMSVPLLGAAIQLAKVLSEGTKGTVIAMRGTAQVHRIFVPVAVDYIL